MGVFDVSCLFS